MNKITLLILFVFVLIACNTQPNKNKGAGEKAIPVINANSKLIDLKDGPNFFKAAGSIVPGVNPNIYKTSSQKVTLYTDLDSISLDITPNAKEQHNFVILLNGKDSVNMQVVWEQSRLDILKKAADYNYSDGRFVPEFTYQPQDDPNLLKTRKELKLDSIAGNGSQLSQIFNLLHWVHNSVRHDGYSNNPENKNAIDLIKVCKTENRGVSCRMMAIMLNECYLAMGIKSRYVTCLPKDREDNDCHVINMVYSDQLDKWIWIDPTFNAYVMDENGDLLGISEVRERLIKEQALVLNADANWNRTSLQTKRNYLETYMAKNLYRFQIPLVSEYGAETWAAGKQITFVELLPLDDKEQTPQRKEEINKQLGTRFTYYKTNNPDKFWTKPE